RLVAQPVRHRRWARGVAAIRSVARCREGIEPPTRGFSVNFRGFEGFINQSLAVSCRPIPRHTKAQSWHTQSELVTFLAHARESSYEVREDEFTLALHAEISGGPKRRPTIVSRPYSGGGAPIPAPQELPVPARKFPVRSIRTTYPASGEWNRSNEIV